MDDRLSMERYDKRRGSTIKQMTSKATEPLIVERLKKKFNARNSGMEATCELICSDPVVKLTVAFPSRENFHQTE